jgi:ABC-2 type transport system ATP-binding protein
MMEGLRVPDSGEVRVLDLDATRQAAVLKQRIGVALQTAALYPNLTVTEIIDLFRSFYRRSRPTQELIEALDLGERRDAATKVLSGGQRQRLSVALALVNDPEVLFLDEPTTGMDPQARRSLWGLVRGLADRGTTVVLTTHYMEEAEQLCDRIAVMDHGHVLELGTVSELVDRRFHERAVRFTDLPALSDADLAALPGATRVVRDEGTAEVWTRDVATTIGGLLTLTRERDVEPADLAVRRATLEDLFLELTGRALRD